MGICEVEVRKNEGLNSFFKVYEVLVCFVVTSSSGPSTVPDVWTINIH